MNPVMNNPEMQETRQVQKTREAEVSKAEDTIPQETARQNIDKLELSAEAQSYLDEVNSPTDSAEETAETVNVNELYSYTESELKDLLSSGEITQIEYDNEMASRGITT